MLDVHLPHHPTHTWTDFFIHIATIVVGLLIAIGLEQTVEAIHHRHERAEIAERLQREGERNEVLIEKILYWDRAVRDDARIELASLKTLPQADAVSWTVAETGVKDPGIPLRPSMEAWEAVKSTSAIELLPPNSVAVHGRVYLELQQELQPYAQLGEAFDRLSNFEELVNSKLNPGDHVTLTRVQRERLEELLPTIAAAANRDIERWTLFRAANASVLRGATTLDEMNQDMSGTLPNKDEVKR